MSACGQCARARPILAKGLCASCYNGNRQRLMRESNPPREIACDDCGCSVTLAKGVTGPPPRRCSECTKKARREQYTAYVERHPARMIGHKRKAELKRKFGLTPEDYARMLASQDSRCAICRTDKPGGRWGTFAVDHCHATGQVRGLLCNPCNLALGRFGDDPERLMQAALYIESFRPLRLVRDGESA